MHTELLDILRCPFCGGRLAPVQDAALELDGEELRSGILACYCCTFPVVAGIPVMTVDHLAETAMQQLAAGEPEPALWTLLGLDESKQEEFRRFVAKGRGANYREGIEILSPDAEGTYFVYRFSDPTYLTSQAVLCAVGQNACCFARRALDLCGGSGHLTRTLCQLSGGAEVVLADGSFAKLWLAKRITAPDCQPVCCDANNPLPFEQGTFSLVVCSDAYHYIWSKRLLAGEMMRLAGEDGTVVLPHVHNSLGANFSAGMTLTPEHYQQLFANLGARLFRDSAILTQLINRESIDLSVNEPVETLEDEAALTLIATRREEVYRSYAPADDKCATGELRVNPLYQIEETGGEALLRLAFPSDLYAEEYGACKRYLPERLTLPAALLRNLSGAALDGDVKELLRHYVLLDLPEGYC